MKDRLIELIEQGDKTFADKYTGKVMLHIDELYDFIADYLLENGVIVPPCKIGDTVYRIVKMSTGVTNKHKVLYKDGKITGIITPCEPTIKYFIRCVDVTKINFFDVCENFGKTVFLTKEEAQKALRKEDEGE